jgi:hypothetical protein
LQRVYLRGVSFMADQIPENRPENKEPAEGSRETTGAPLDGSTSGTIGGGGRETGGPTERRQPGDSPATRPDNAASGRMAPDPLGATAQPDPTKTTRTDTSQANTRETNDDETARERNGAASARD